VKMEKRSFPENIDTERLELRRYDSDDVTGILQLARENREQLIREFAQVAGLQDGGQAKAFIEEKSKQWREGTTYCYGIWAKGERKPIGQIQVKNIAWEVPSAELSYFIDRQQQRRGYASESITAVLEVLFGEMQFERIFVRILPANQGSFLLAKKLGFQEEGLHRKAFRCGFGELHDVRYLSIVAEEYRKKV
jgi:[ribosomal protein S5]-alanine N-acetyltransferase